MVVVLPLWLEVLSWLVEVALSLVILWSAIPRSAIPLAVVLELVLSGCRVVKRSILSKVLVVISLWSIVPIIISVRAVIPPEWGRSIVISLVGWGSISSVLVSRRAVVSVVSMYVVLLLLLLWFRNWVGFFY